MSDSSLSGVLARSTDTGTRPRFSVCDTTTPFWSLRQLVMGSEEAGLSAVALDAARFHEDWDDEGIAALHDSRLEVSSLTCFGGFTGCDGRSFDESVNDGFVAVRLAGLLGASSLVVTSGGRGHHIRSHAHRLVIDGLRSLAHTAAGCNLGVAILPLHPLLGDSDCFLESIDEALDVIRACDHADVGLAFDGHWLYQEPALLGRIPEFAGVTRVVRLADWDSQPNHSLAGALPGDGRLPLAEVVRRFHEAGYRGRFEVCVDADRYSSLSHLELLLECRRRTRAVRSAVTASRG